MKDVRITLSRDLKDFVEKRADALGISKAEYFRILAKLDISVQRYQDLVTYINISEYHQKLNIYAIPLKEAKIVKFN